MRGYIHVKAGRYQLSNGVLLHLHTSDTGSVIRLDDTAHQRRYSCVIDETGQVVDPRVAAMEVSNSSRPATGKVGPPVLATKRKKARTPARRVRFVIQHGPTYRPRSRAFVLTAFQDREYVHVLWRVESAGVIYYEGQLMIHGDDPVLVNNQIKPVDRLAKERWADLQDLPDNAVVQMQYPWRKMAEEEIAELVEGRTFLKSAQASFPEHQEQRSANKSRARQRPIYKTRDVTVLACGACNFDHDDGEPATSITIGYKGDIEPLVINLRDTRTLVVRLLTSLYTADDEVADRVLHQMFPFDDKGAFYWPDDVQ